MDKGQINPLLSKDYYDDLGEEDFEIRCFSQKVNLRNSFKKIVDHILLSAVKPKNEFKS